MLSMTRLPLLCCLVACCLVAAEDDPLLREQQKYEEAVAKLQKTYDDGVAKERTKAIPLIITIAKRQLGKGDMPGAVKAWKAVLRLDDQHADARQFFTSIGQLEQVLAELETEENATADLLGEATAPALGKPWQGTVTIKADKPLLIGDLPTGTQIALQYQSGAWTWRQGAQPMMSPDDATSRPAYRVILTADNGAREDIPPGTMQQAWSWTLPSELKGVMLRLATSNGRAPAGSVTYKVTLVKPKAK